VFLSAYVCFENRVHAGKVSLSIRLEPLHNITIEAKMNGSLSSRHDDVGGLVLSSPRSRMALTWLRECRTMVDFSFISARFPGADDADKVFAPPGERDTSA
jgi:hypothetical protein